MLWYKIGVFGSWNSILMISNGALYEATIPGSGGDTDVFYYIVSQNIYGEASSKGNQSVPLIIKLNLFLVLQFLM